MNQPGFVVVGISSVTWPKMTRGYYCDPEVDDFWHCSMFYTYFLHHSTSFPTRNKLVPVISYFITAKGDFKQFEGLAETNCPP